MSAWPRTTALWGACATLGALAGWWQGAPPDTLTFLSVGQGDCAVFRTSGTTILIDAGPLTPTVDSGEKVVVPKLRAMGVESVDLVLLSHPDMDHVGGLRAIKHAFPNLKVGISGAFRGFEPMEKNFQGGELNVSFFLARYGRSLIDELYQAADVGFSNHRLIYPGGVASQVVNAY